MDYRLEACRNRSKTIQQLLLGSEFSFVTNTALMQVRELLQLLKLSGVQTLNHSSTQLLICFLRLQKLYLKLSTGLFNRRLNVRRSEGARQTASSTGVSETRLSATETTTAPSTQRCLETGDREALVETSECHPHFAKFAIDGSCHCSHTSSHCQNTNRPEHDCLG